MTGFNYPNDITKDTPAVAAEVQGNFDSLLAFLLTEMVQRDGTISMTAPLTLFGNPTIANHAANKAYVDAVLPVGTIMEFGGTTLPNKWLWCNADTYSETDKPLLFNAIGRGYTDAAIPAGSFQVPDKRGRVTIGAGRVDGTTGTDFVRGAKGGKADSELLQHLHNVPAYSHSGSASGTVNGNGAHTHSLSGTATGAGGHNHGMAAGAPMWWTGSSGLYIGYTASPGPFYENWAKSSWAAAGDHTHPLSGTAVSVGHSHTWSGSISVNNHAAKNTENTGAGTTLVDKNLPPYVVSNYIIYAGE